jgi:hypothetical protein
LWIISVATSQKWKKREKKKEKKNPDLDMGVK